VRLFFDVISLFTAVLLIVIFTAGLCVTIF